MTFIDTHTHLYLEEFDTDRQEVVKRALASGVEKLLLPNVDESTIEQMLQLCEQFPENCFPMIGLHPCSVDSNYKKNLKLMEVWLQKRKFVGIGEVGLDFYWSQEFISEQYYAFKHQCLMAAQNNLPLVIHTRNAIDEAIIAIEELNNSDLRGVFHCFGGTLDQAKRIINLGFYLGIGGVLTYKNSKLDEVLSQVELKHILIETDSPYLTPVPHRGKRNESSYLSLVAQKLSDVKGIDILQVAQITSSNAISLFGDL